MTTAITNEQLFVKTALASWNTTAGRASKIFDSLSDEQLLKEIAPGKNRGLYLLGHLIAVNDAMIPQLRLGEASYTYLWESFVKQRDRAVSDLPPTAELRQNWKDSLAQLSEMLSNLSPSDWLERHATVSEEDFINEPHRNRLAILLSRTGHLSYHIGQLVLIDKSL